MRSFNAFLGLMIVIFASSLGLAAQTHVLEKSNNLGEQQQLDLLLSGGQGSSSLDPLHGLYPEPPNSAAFRNESNLTRFMEEFYAQLAPPQINYTWHNLFFSGAENLDLALATSDAPVDPKKGKHHFPALLVKEN